MAFIKTKIFIINKYLTIFALLVCFFFFSNKAFAGNTVMNFDDFVRKEERKQEVAEIEAKSESEKYFEKRLIHTNVIRLLSFALFSGWCLYMLKAWKKYLKPFDFSYFKANNILKKEDLEAMIENTKPLEVSALVGLGSLSGQDLTATVFDLISRNELLLDSASEEFRLYPNYETKKDIENFEDFLIQWLIGKIGKNEYFSTVRLKDYLRLDSNAAQFDIDYDIWEDEASEFLSDKNILDKAVEDWKSNLMIVAVLYGVFGLILLYIANSSLVLLLFLAAFLCYRIPLGFKRRSQEGELKYEKLMLYKNYMEEDLRENKPCEAALDRYFSYSIPLASVETVLEYHKKYEAFYRELENEFDDALKYSHLVVRAATEV